MTQQSRAEAYEALDRFLHGWGCDPLDLDDGQIAEYQKDKKGLQDAIDAAVDEAYQAGYNDGYDGKPEPEGFNPEYAESPWKAEL